MEREYDKKYKKEADEDQEEENGEKLDKPGARRHNTACSDNPRNSTYKEEPGGDIIKKEENKRKAKQKDEGRSRDQREEKMIVTDRPTRSKESVNHEGRKDAASRNMKDRGSDEDHRTSDKRIYVQADQTGSVQGDEGNHRGAQKPDIPHGMVELWFSCNGGWVG